jgi:hypothetical protein
MSSEEAKTSRAIIIHHLSGHLLLIAAIDFSSPYPVLLLSDDDRKDIKERKNILTTGV